MPVGPSEDKTGAVRRFNESAVDKALLITQSTSRAGTILGATLA